MITTSRVGHFKNNYIDTLEDILNDFFDSTSAVAEIIYLNTSFYSSLCEECNKLSVLHAPSAIHPKPSAIHPKLTKFNGINIVVSKYLPTNVIIISDKNHLNNYAIHKRIYKFCQTSGLAQPEDIKDEIKESFRLIEPE